jgi:hypothetical protein
VVGREHPVSRDGGEQALVEHGLILRVAGWAVELERNEARWAGTAAGGPPCDNSQPPLQFLYRVRWVPLRNIVFQSYCSLS